MNPPNNQTAGTPLPAPAEQQVPVTNLPGTNSQPAPPMTIIPLPLPTTATLTASSQAAPISHSQVAGFQIADDKDIIEPEWVHKAKAIAIQNRNDPYKQSEELTVFKADYMQKRYNKTIKLK